MQIDDTGIITITEDGSDPIYRTICGALCDARVQDYIRDHKGFAPATLVRAVNSLLEDREISDIHVMRTNHDMFVVDFLVQKGNRVINPTFIPREAVDRTELEYDDSGVEINIPSLIAVTVIVLGFITWFVKGV